MPQARYVPEHRAIVTQCLAELPPTLFEIADFFEREGIKGNPHRAGRCCTAVWLQRTLHASGYNCHVEVLTTGVRLRLSEVPLWETMIVLPVAVRHFEEACKHGRFPWLRRGVGGWLHRLIRRLARQSQPGEVG